MLDRPGDDDGFLESGEVLSDDAAFLENGEVLSDDAGFLESGEVLSDDGFPPIGCWFALFFRENETH